MKSITVNYLEGEHNLDTILCESSAGNSFRNYTIVVIEGVTITAEVIGLKTITVIRLMSSENLLQLLPQGLLWDFVRRKKLGHRGHTSVQKNKKKYCNRYLSLGTALTNV